eukprot:12265783-Alexandrium_andersonii.AAC.1
MGPGGPRLRWRLRGVEPPRLPPDCGYLRAGRSYAEGPYLAEPRRLPPFPPETDSLCIVAGDFNY